MKITTLVYPFILLFLSSCSVNEEQASHEAKKEAKSATHTHRPPIQDHQTKAGASIRRERQPQPALTNKQRFFGVLQAHNRTRLKHGLQPLKWSNKLAQYSQEWANYLGRGNHCQIKHRPGTPTYGENIYRSSSLQWSSGKTEVKAINIKEVVKSWTDEERWYDYKRNRCQPGKQCGHYTQIVWKNTTEVGCAMKICPDKSQTWVCSYNPAGNYTGVRPY